MIDELRSQIHQINNYSTRFQDSAIHFLGDSACKEDEVRKSAGTGPSMCLEAHQKLSDLEPTHGKSHAANKKKVTKGQASQSRKALYMRIAEERAAQERQMEELSRKQEEMEEMLRK